MHYPTLNVVKHQKGVHLKRLFAKEMQVSRTGQYLFFLILFFLTILFWVLFLPDTQKKKE
ncbi:hypothetical protein EFB08_00795 [Rufibacter latericius]|uniref:Uncharacterized protein n=1 Tax=Rufibacter latericius TaxID=2487040 RepID=A0A3M9MZY2_9BACT|nr:hypothetical protein EFB08_00795 [Rufibacter latericius]